jgi:hypothetical protein
LSRRAPRILFGLLAKALPQLISALDSSDQHSTAAPVRKGKSDNRTKKFRSHVGKFI